MHHAYTHTELAKPTPMADTSHLLKFDLFAEVVPVEVGD